MRFSLTGDLATAALFVNGIAASPDHELVCLHTHGELEHALPSGRVPQAERVASPEAALLRSDCDTVVIAESNANFSIQLVRHASQADLHVVVIAPRDVSTAYSYELNLLLDESQLGIMVVSGSCYVKDDSVAVDAEGDWEFGLLSMLKDANHTSTLIDAVDVVCSLGFADSQVTVLGIPDDAGPVANRQIVLSDDASRSPVRPSVALRFSDNTACGQLTCRSENTVRELSLPVPEHSSELSTKDAVRLCDHVSSMLLDRPACHRAIEQYSETLQVVAAVDKSIRRRRTVDISMDDLTERAAFKTQMTAIGCGILTWMMLGLVGYLLIGQLFSPPDKLMLVLRGLWILPVVLYLFAQLLLPVARGRNDNALPKQSESDNK